MSSSQLNSESLAFATAIRTSSRAYDSADREKALVNVIDAIGVTSAGFRRPELARLIGSSLIDASATHASALLGNPLRCRVHEAALVNAMAGHLDDFDDDETRVSISHVSVPSLMAALATAGIADVSGARLIDAYIAGVGTIVALGEVLNPDHYYRGWHASATLGVFGAAVATSEILDLSVEEMATALSFAVTASSGSRSAFGSDAKPYQVAAATSAGVSSALLAKAGLTANTSLFTKMGLVPLYGGDALAISRAMARLSGRPLTDPGVTIKAYPCCTDTHAAIEGAARIRARQGERMESFCQNIRAVRVEVDSRSLEILIHSDPKTALEAKFSMQFCVAAALCRPSVGLTVFEDSEVSAPDIASLIPRCTMAGLPWGDRPTPTRVVVTMNDGVEFEEVIEATEGSPARPPSAATLRNKFIDTCQGDGAAALELLASLPDAPSWLDLEAQLLPLLRR